MTPKISPSELSAIADLLRESSGIDLDQQKGYLVETRLSTLLRERSIGSWAALAQRARRDQGLRDAMVDALTTNETSFFRDPKTFDLLAHKLIPEHYERLGAHAPLRIWSAAASTGQELYSVGMLLREMLGPLTTRKISILGTDISPTALSAASAGLYSQLEVSRGLSAQRLSRYFDKEGARYRIHDEIRALARYRQMNLLDRSAIAGLGGPFDIVLCRNVAIYFDDDRRRQLFENLARAMTPSGVLLLGLTESMRGGTGSFRREAHRGVTYYLRQSLGQAAGRGLLARAQAGKR